MSAISNKITYQIVGDDKQLMQDLDKAEKGIESREGAFLGKAKKLGAAIGGAFATKQIWEWGTAFETNMAAASTLFGDAQVNTQQLDKDMLALSDRTGLAADALGGALYNALSAGVPATDDMSEALNFLESSSKLAAAGFTDIDTAQSATIKTLNAYKMDISEAERIQKILIQTQNKGITTVDQLGSVLAQVTPTAAAMNVSFEQVGASLATMTAQGTPTAQATTQLNQLIAELGKEGTKASKILKEKTGKSFKELMDEGRNLSEVVSLMQVNMSDNSMAIAEMMSTADAATGKTATFEEALAALGLSSEDVEGELIDMFGSLEAGKAALAIGGQNAEKFTENLEAMGTETDVVGEAFDKVTNTSAEQFSKVLNQLKNIGIDLFLQFAPFITELLPMLGEILQMLLPPIMEIVKTLLPPLLEVFKALIPPLTELIIAIMPVLIEIFEAFIPPIMALLDVLMFLIDFIVGVFTGQWTDGWKEIGKFFVELWENLSAWITDTWNSIKDTAVSVFNSISDFFSNILSFMSGTFNTYIEMIKGYFRGLWSGISSVIEGIKRVFSGLIDFFTGVFTGNWRQALNGIKDIFGGAFDALVGIAKAPINAVIGLINGFIGGLNNIKIPSWVPGLGGKGINIPKLNYLKVGLQYVPDDDFPAMLHEGEAVLTKEQADRWRKGLPRFESYHQYDFAGSNNITLKNEMVGIVEMDGYNVGKIVLRNIDEVREMG